MKSTKKSFIMSVLAVLLCVAMLVGTTFAWFTDSVSSGKNRIVAGNLDIEVYHQTTGMAAAEKIDAVTNLFPIALWEPGAVAYENITVKNVGNLALKYALDLNVADMNSLTTDDVAHNLTEVIKVAVVPGGFDGNRDAAKELTGYETLASFQKTGALEPNSADDVYGVVLYWEPTENDNLWNANNGKTVNDSTLGVTSADCNNALFVEFGVNVVATQQTSESDSFNNQYDALAGTGIFNGNDVQTVVAGEATTFTVKSTPASDNDLTTVSIPADAMEAGSKTLTVKATSVLPANANSAFDISTDNGAVGAIELTVVDQNGAEVHDFNSPVTVQTKVAKGMTNVQVKYIGEGTQPSNVTYDKDTGILSFTTDHFSTFAIGADETTYVESTNTVYMTFADAVAAAADNGDTVSLVKNAEVTSNLRIAKSFTLNLNTNTLALSSSGVLTFGENTSYQLVPVKETITGGTIKAASSSNYIRFEDGCEAAFDKVDFALETANQTSDILKVYAKNTTGADTLNKYTFKDCSFTNAAIDFGGSSSSKNLYNVLIDKCDFNAKASANGQNLIKLEAYSYGNFTVKNTDMNYDNNPSGAGGYCLYVATYLSYVDGNKANVTLENVNMATTNKANPYSGYVQYYNSAYSDSAVFTLNGTNTFTVNGKAVECTVFNNNYYWVENAAAMQAAYAEYKNYATVKPTGYNSQNYYLVECNGYYFVGGQNTQFVASPTLVFDGDTLTQVKPNSWYTFKTFGTEDLSLALTDDNTAVHIYTLAN